MKVLILAAGRGTRISRYLSGKPKCTVDIGGGQCLIEYTIDLLHSRGIQDIGIVLGYEAQVIREVLADKGVSFFYNPFYDVTNSIASAWFAKEFLTGDDLLIMNGDVYLEEKLLDRILAQGRSPVMFADESRRETADYKFFYEDGILKKYGKELTGDEVTGEYIGIGRFSAAFMPEFICRMEEMIDRQEHGVWWENVVYSMIGQQPVYVEDVSGHFWAEVVTYYDNGETWYLDNEVEEIARKVQSEHTETNGKLGLIENFIETLLPAGWDTWDLDRRLMFWSGGFGPEQKGTMRRTRVCALEIWQELFKGDPKNYTTQHAREITGLLKSLPEWSMTTATNCGALYGRQRGFIRKER